MSSISTGTEAEQLFADMFDDAAVFPPGNASLPDAVAAHLRHLRGPQDSLVGPLVVAATHLEVLEEVIAGSAVPVSMDVAVTTPVATVGETVRRAQSVPGVRLAVLEVAPGETDEVAGILGGLQGCDMPGDVTVYVEVPRDPRGQELLRAMSGTTHRAKFRTGGVVAALYPDAAELAEGIVAAARENIAFKATAGLHHALRNRDEKTGFEQHGFLNLLVAADVARQGGDIVDVAAILECRDAGRMVAAVHSTDCTVRETFRSFGTCSVFEPIDELVSLGLLPAYLSGDRT